MRFRLLDVRSSHWRAAAFGLVAIFSCGCSAKDNTTDAAAAASDTGQGTGIDTIAGDTTPGDQSAYDCDKAQQEQAAAIAMAVGLAGDCSLASDCTITMSIKTDCGGTCGQVIAKGKEAEFATAMAAVNKEFCKDNGYKEHCTMPIPSCGSIVVACTAGRCKAEH
ncbi:MAG: hypothetical protein HY902_18400 [Deltaproteobacteria bacterium]|nr:hypothetical protein [Deltaproteobacteria bacterium]